MTSQTKSWYCIYTKPRWEKKVYGLLQSKGFESYCPLNKVSKQWSDRIKVVEEPLFKSYVFIRAAAEEQTNIRMTAGVVNFVYWLGKPAVIKDKEIESIQRFLSDYEDVQVASIGLHEGEKVIVTSGALMDKVGTIKKVMKSQVELVIECLGYKLIANLPKTKLKTLK